MNIVLYHEEFRTALFLSSLTLGSFLFTMKTFIIQSIKKEVYDHPCYKEKVKNRAKLRGIDPLYYRQLKSLSRLIFWAIALALFNSFLQITIGAIENIYSSIACLAFSALSWGLVATVLIVVGRNMNDMIDFSEEFESDKGRDHLEEFENDAGSDHLEKRTNV